MTNLDDVTISKAQYAVSRRGFLIGASTFGVGLSIGFLPGLASGASEKAAMDEVNAWVQIATDDTVTVRIVRSEMGQGTLTGLAQLVAEELQCDWNKVTWEFPTPGESLARERVWGSFSTGGSRGLRSSQQYVREGGAAARMMLVQAAANKWGVPAVECRGDNSVITHGKSGRTTTYGNVAMAASELSIPENIELKDPADWTIAGKPLKRLDTTEKLTGKLVYGADVKLPGMLLASIKDCPVMGGKLVSFDDSAVMKMKGVRAVVKVETAVGTNGVAVVADTWWQANSALNKLPIKWDFGPNGNFNDRELTELLESGLDAEEAFKGNWEGDVKVAFSEADKMVEGVYKCPSQNHAPMEPMNTTALYTSDKCEIWCPTQNGEAALAAASEASGVAIEQCEVYKTILGGGFGRRGAPDFIHQAVEIAKSFPGTPVKLQWTREEDQRHGFYHPTTMAKMRGSLDSRVI